MGLTVASDLQPLLPDTGPVQAQILSAFNGRYGRFVTAVADSGTPPLTDHGNARVSLRRADKDISVLTEIDQGSLHRSLTATVPLASPASLVPTIAGDLAYLWFSFSSFSALALGPPPRSLLHSSAHRGRSPRCPVSPGPPDFPPRRALSRRVAGLHRPFSARLHHPIQQGQRRLAIADHLGGSALGHNQMVVTDCHIHRVTQGEPWPWCRKRCPDRSATVAAPPISPASATSLASGPTVCSNRCW